MSRLTGRTDKGLKTMPSLQAWINHNPTNLDLVAPIKARAYGALQAVLGSRPHSNPQIMRKGAERC
jgi:hypothetical protein